MQREATPTTTLKPKRRARLFLTFAAAALFGIAGFAAWWFGFGGSSAPTSARITSAAAPSDASSPASEVDSRSEPQSPAPTTADAGLSSISADPDVRRWIAVDDFTPRAVAAMHRIMEGESPGAMLSFMGPVGKFDVSLTEQRTVIAPSSFARYDRIVDAFVGIDAERVGATFRAMKPALERAHSQISRPGRTLDSTMGKAFGQLLKTPIPAGDIEVTPASEGTNYLFVDDDLERLSPPQKHLVRLGASNEQRVLSKLRALSVALATPPL